jgi:hypothetical protein
VAVVIRLVRVIMRHRLGASLTVFGLAVVTAGAAAAAPLYRAAATNAVITGELAGAPYQERVISRTWTMSEERPVADLRIEEERAQPAFRPGFRTIHGLSLDGTLRDNDQVAMLARTGVCEQLTIVDGRCVSGLNETVLSAPVAARRGLSIGSAFGFQPIVLDRQGNVIPAGPPIPLRVVGLFGPPDTTAAYWAGRTPITASGEPTDIVVVSFETVRLTRSPVVHISSDLLASRAGFDDMTVLRAVVRDEMAEGSRLAYTVSTNIPALLDRVDANERALATDLVIASIPLVLLCWYVLYLAISAGVFRRRGEFALTGLRGVPSGSRRWLGAAEYVVPVILAAPVGYVGVLVLLGALSRFALLGAPAVRAGWSSAAWAAAAILGALLAGALAQWHTSRQPVAALLRGMPSRSRLRPALAAITVALVLAAAASYELRVAGPGGFGASAPVLIALAVGLVGARALAFAADAGGRRAMRRGRVGPALRLLHVARQPGHVQLLGLQVALLTVLGFAAAAHDAADRARLSRVRAELGTATELQVAPLPVSRLLAGVRIADPTGRYAAAVATFTAGRNTPILAVDMTRFAHVALWDSSDGLTAAQAATAVRPIEPDTLRVTGPTISMRVTTTPTARDTPVVLKARLVTNSGALVEVVLGATSPGVHTYQARADQCVAGCRLLAVVLDPRGISYDIDLVVHDITGVALTDVNRWRVWPASAGGGRLDLASTTSGFRLSYVGEQRPDTLLAPVTVPDPMPALLTTATHLTTSGRTDELPMAPVPLTAPRTIPGLGLDGALVDLEYVSLARPEMTVASESAVWLSADAPPDVTQRLREAGIVTLNRRSLASTVERLNGGGPALALGFYLGLMLVAVGVGMAAVAVVAAVEHSSQSAQLRSLRVQGLRSGTAWRAAFGAWFTIIGVAFPAAVVAAGVTWLVARTSVTVFIDSDGSGYVPRWPHLPHIVGVLGVAALAILVVGAGAAAILVRTLLPTRAVRKGGR